ncbi:hypothetical protein AWH61_19780 [Alteromonas sp. W12]|nr:hypothetical protein AWH61_19780 [Alteromonas sp. W12]
MSCYKSLLKKTFLDYTSKSKILAIATITKRTVSETTTAVRFDFNQMTLGDFLDIEKKPLM